MATDDTPTIGQKMLNDAETLQSDFARDTASLADKIGSIMPSFGSRGVGTNTGALSKGEQYLRNTYGQNQNANISQPASGQTTTKFDHRARLRPMPKAEEFVYGERDRNTNILFPLYESGGLIWPFTPSINIQQSVEYTAYQAVHSNQEYKAYSHTPAFSFACAGIWTAQNEQEKAYCLAGLHFLRTVTKMHFGINDKDNRGTPPPVLLFSAYGNLMFNDLPVIINSFTVDFTNDVDYVQFQRTVGQQRQTGTAWLPAKFNVSVQMTVQKTPSQMRNDFNLNKFRTGELLLSGKGGWF
jgi:hypothetical protein